MSLYARGDAGHDSSPTVGAQPLPQNLNSEILSLSLTNPLPTQEEENYANYEEADFDETTALEGADGDLDNIVTIGGDSNQMPVRANKTRITTPYMTKYERARILGTRALQISLVPSFPFFQVV